MAKMDINVLLKELNSEVEQLAAVPGKWTEFLRSAAWNYKYNFQNQLLIFSQKPEATACAEFDVWNTRLHRYVAKGAKGIAVLNDIGDKVGYVFDVSDTRSPTNEELKLWQLMDENYVGVLFSLNLDHEFNCESIEDALGRQVDYLVENAGMLYLPEGEVREDSNFVSTFNEYIKYSSLVVALTRCGFDEAAKTYANLYLRDLSEVFNSSEKLIALGTAVSSVSELVLREIEHDVRQINKYNLSLNKEDNIVEVDNNENDIQTSRGISDSRDSYREGSAFNAEDRENGNIEVEISSVQQTELVSDTSNTRRVGESFDGDRGSSEPAEGTVNSEFVDGESGAGEEREPDSLGGTYELNSVDGRRDSEKGIDISLDDVVFPTVDEQVEIIENAVENAETFEIPQSVIDADLCNGSSFTEGKFRIYEQYQKRLSLKNNAEFLKKEYGDGGRTTIEGYSQDHNSKGIRIYKGYGDNAPEIRLNWNQVARRIGELIKAGQYLNEKELAEYPQWVEKENVHNERIELGTEFIAIIMEFNDYLRTNNRDDELLNQYVLTECGRCFMDAKLKTSVLSVEGDYIVPLMTEALNTIIAADSSLKERAEAFFDVLSGKNLKRLGFDDENKETVEEKEYVSVPSYKVGDLFFNGATKYAIVEISESSVYLSDVEFELNSLDMDKADFEGIVLNNPSNNHLVKTVLIDEYNKQLNHAIAVIDEVEKSLVPSEPVLEVVDLVKVGDFFEVRGDNAQRIAEMLELVPTNRVVNEERIPLVGFPVSFLDIYNERLAMANIVMTERVSEDLSESVEVIENNVEEADSVSRNSLIARNYDALNRLAPGILNGDYKYLRFESGGLEPLTVENIGENFVSVMHTYTQYGDMMRDPDIVLLVDNKSKTATAASYEMSALSLYKEYIDFNSYKVIKPKEQEETNEFFRDWMKNIEQQGYVLVRGTTREGDEVRFDAEGNVISEEVPEGIEEAYQVRLYRPYANPDTVKAYVAEVHTPLEEGHIVENEHEVYESREAAENGVDNFNTVFDFDEDFRNEVLGRVPDARLHRYYSTQRPVGPGTYPKVHGNEPVNIVNFDDREFQTDINRAAWGYLEFERSLTDKQVDDYELVKGPVIAKPFVEAVERGVRELTGEHILSDGTELREGDIVEYTRPGTLLSASSKHMGVIEWNESYDAYVIRFDDLAMRFLSQETHNIVKLGSIYTKPENKMAVRLQFDDDKNIVAYVEEATVDCPSDHIQLGEFELAGAALNFCAHVDNLLKTDEEYRQRQIVALNEKVIESLEDQIASLKPTVYCEWSEHNDIEDDTVYPFVEFNALMKRLDDETVKIKEEYRARGDYYRYFKTKFEIRFPDGFEYCGRQDIGDGDGSLLDHVRTQAAHNLKRIQEDGYNGMYTGENKESAIQFYSDFLNNYIPLLEKEVEEYELSYDKEAYKIGYGSLGNGTTVWNSADIDREANDYRTIAHISDDGTVKLRVDDLPAGVKTEINQKAIVFTQKYMDELMSMSEDKFKFWYFNEMLRIHPTYIPGRDFTMNDYVQCYNVLHSESFVRDVSLPLITQLEGSLTSELSDASKETRQEMIRKVQNGEISTEDISKALEGIDTSKINDVNDVYDALNNNVGKDLVEDSTLQKSSNFKITDFNLGVGGPKEKYRNNVAAIRLLNELEAEGRFATPEEQEVLSKYVGWGGLDQAFDVNNGSWAKEYNELQELLTPDEYRSAKSSVLSAFYTPPVVIDTIYEGLRNLGFKRGNVLEPSCGVGNFFGMIPDDLRDANLFGVELDSISGRIAKQLYPDAKIAVKGYEDTNFKNGFFDVAVGNVPFGQFKVNDKEYNKLNYNIHDYFFAKTLDKVRPGGVVAFITSKGTLDKQNPEVRKYIAQRAELLGAIRLPNDTFTANAGTKATSDIIFLQKREKPLEVEPDWVHLGFTEDGLPINSYYTQHPEMVLGHMEMDRMQYGREDTTCAPIQGASLAEQLNVAIKNIQGKISSKSLDFDEGLDNGRGVVTDLVVSIPADPDVRNFSYTVVDGDIYYRLDNEMIKQELNPTREQRIRGLIEIRESLRHLIDLQRYDYSDAEIEAEQRKLNELYDAYAAKYGLLNSRGNSLAFQDDNSYYLLCSLENVDEKGELISKADMFTKKTIKRHVPVVSVGTASEALAVSISEKASVDLDYMSDLADMPKERLVEELQGVIFRVPFEVDIYGNSLYVTADEYLSGNVREKLVEAQRAAAEDPSYNINVMALEQAVPKDLEAHEIDLRLGSIWIPEDVVDEFMWQLLDTPIGYRSNTPDVHAHYNEVNGSWSIENKNWYGGSVKARSTYGTSRMHAYDIIHNTLNLKTVEIYDYVEDAEGKRKRVLNKNETVVAQQKQELIKEEFVNWVWNDPERRQRLVRIYNDKFNNIKLREYNGEHLVFEGMNPEITLMEHQKNAVAHAIYGGNTLLAHEVGAGKTFEMAAIAMESKRLGLCSKSLIVVPNHLLQQWASEFYQLYPSANLLVASKKDFEPANRKKFCSRIATGDYDAVIIGHSQFEKIPLSVDTQTRYIQEELDEIEEGIRELEASREERSSIKSLEKTRKSLQLRLEKLNDIEQDDVITFEELGVDKLFIDEAHYFKNLFLYTKMHNVAGISQTEAKKSSDLYVKTRFLNDLTGGRGVVFATGTPISNSMTEAFTMQRYLQYDTLKRNGLVHFDAWASTFGEIVTAVELAPEGTGYRAKNRFAKFYNIPELMTLFKLVADIKTGDDLDLPKPDAEFHVVQAQPSAIQEEIVESLGERAKKVRDGGVDPTEDNMLKITNDGRLLGLDQRCFDESLPDYEDSKVNLAVENIFNVWEEYKGDKLAQLVFSDISTPTGKGFSVYEDVKQKLIAKGVPAEEIAFIHDANTDVQKEKLFSKVRSGEVRVLMGSTPKMGAGTNVQDKLIALHDLDCPWRPSDLEQRLGRILRQGNKQEKVHIYRYVTQGTFDAYLWQLVENKQKFISQIMTSKSPVRSADDIDDASLSYAEIKSLCIKDPRIKEKMELDVAIAKLKLVRANFLSQKHKLEDDISLRYPSAIRKEEQYIIGYKADIELVKTFTLPNEKTGFSPMVVNGIKYEDKKEAGVALLAAVKKCSNASKTEIGEYRGFKMLVQYDPFTKQRHLYLKGALTHPVELGQSETGNIVRIDNVLGGLETALISCEQSLDDLKKELAIAQVEVKKDFPQEEEFKTMVSRVKELDALLRMDERGGGERSQDDIESERSGGLDSVLASAYSRAGENNGSSYDDKDRDLI